MLHISCASSGIQRGHVSELLKIFNWIRVCNRVRLGGRGREVTRMGGGGPGRDALPGFF